MSDETAAGSAGVPDGRGHPGGSPGEQSPLQARAQFLKNRSWDAVVSLNRGACARGGAQHGQNSESYGALEAEWATRRNDVSTLQEALDFLKSCHKRAPFLFFNGNTFADVGRAVVDFVFAELPTVRRREVMSAVAHYIAGVLDRESMVRIVEGLWNSALLAVGDRVSSLRGTTRGVILEILDDGRIVWRPDDAALSMIALPETLQRLD
jgi:hypothetical protein